MVMASVPGFTVFLFIEIVYPGPTLPVNLFASAVANVEIALAWLLAISPVTLPIPGTATRAHLEASVAAAPLHLSRAEIDAISAAVSGAQVELGVGVGQGD